MFDEEKTVAEKAPVDGIQINDLNKKKKKKKKKKNFLIQLKLLIFIIKIQLQIMIDRIKNETSIKNLK